VLIVLIFLGDYPAIVSGGESKPEKAVSTGSFTPIIEKKLSLT